MAFDAVASIFTGGLWVVLFAAYALRVRRFGSFHSQRVDSVGGTAIMGENIMQATYWAVGPVVRGLVAIGFTANGVTTSALILGIGAGCAVAFGYFGVACLLATISTVADILDGQVARLTKTGSNVGELYDAVVDRYTEFAFIAGFIVFARHDVWLVGLALLALQASFMISYASAKAEAMNVEVPRGLMRRHERAAILTLGSGVSPLVGSTMPFAIALALVGVIGLVAGIQRFFRIGRALRQHA